MRISDWSSDVCSSDLLVDIGGIGLAPDGRQVYHEGLFIPLMPLIEQGRINAWFLEVVRANVREPIQVEGDIYALIACNEIGCRRLVGMMDEYGLDSLDELGAFIVDAIGRASGRARVCPYV